MVSQDPKARAVLNEAEQRGGKRADGHHPNSCSLSVISVPLCYQAPTNCPWSCMIRGEQQLL